MKYIDSTQIPPLQFRINILTQTTADEQPALCPGNRVP